MTDATAPPPREGWFERDGTRLHFLEWGAAEPGQRSMLLLHGLSSNARFWERTAARLDGRHVVALDQRSHGLSDRPQAGNLNPTFVADARGLVDHLGLDRPLVAGHSWGAVIALEYAAAHAGACGALCTMDGPVWAGGARWEDVKDFVQPPFPLYATLDEAYAAQAAYNPEAWADDLRPFVAAGLVAEAGGYRSGLTVPVRRELLQDMFEADAAALWAAVRAPASVLLAEVGPAPFVEMKRRGAGELAAHKPEVRVRWFATPHDIPLYEPAEVAGELEALAAKVV